MPSLPRPETIPELRPAGAGGRLVAVGGGTGLGNLLRGLKSHLAPEQITAVVTMADDGGSSGRLRRELGALPPGDIRNCLVALADDEDRLAELFQYRFANGTGLSGHSFGNLFLTALTEITGDFHQAVLTAERILSVHGRILPATVEDVRLRARGESGRIYEGESAIGRSGERLKALVIEPADAAAFSPAVEAVGSADLILIGPGSLYTSILPNLLIPGIRRALEASAAPVVLIQNLMTQPGETDHMTALDHLHALEEHAGTRLIDAVVVNSTPPPSGHLELYAEAGAELLEVDKAAFAARQVEVIERDLLARGDLVRHDPDKLSSMVLELMAERVWPARVAATG